MKTYCFDLDGTLCITDGSNYERSVPIQERIDLVNRLYDMGHQIYIDSARGARTGINWTLFTRKQLMEWNLNFHKVRTGVKYSADLYIDDKGIDDISWFKLHRKMLDVS